jgi:hypothetical protein
MHFYSVQDSRWLVKNGIWGRTTGRENDRYQYE